MKESINYFAIVPQTREEKIAMYMKCTKKQLAEMLAESNRFIESITPIVHYGTAQCFNLPEGTRTDVTTASTPFTLTTHD